MPRSYYWLTTPDQTHKSFSIKWRKVNSESKTIAHGTFKDERTSLLNALFKKGSKKHSTTEAEFREIIRNLQSKERSERGEVPITEENALLLNTYIKKKYGTKFSDKRVKNVQGAIQESKRAVLAVGKLSLISSDVDEIMENVLSFSEGNHSIFNRYIYRLRGILKLNGLYERIEQLAVLPESPKEVTQINYRQLAVLATHIRSLGLQKIAKVSSETFIALIQFLFWSGLRIGEAVATNESYLEIDGRALKVDWQIDDLGRKRLPKYGKRRKTHIPKQGLPYFYTWISAPDRNQLDRKQATKKLREFCEQVFKDQLNHISLHGLRHSYAGVMLRHFEDANGRRFTLDDVADFLGDHPWTAKLYYAGFVPDKLTFERAMKITNVELS